MKRTLLFTLFVCLLAFTVQAQYDNNCDGCEVSSSASANHSSNAQHASFKKPVDKKISIFPNPAINYIQLSDAKDVSKIVVINVMGREVKNFEIEKNGKYYIQDLRRGMYLVQIYDHQNKVITTQRLNKD